LQIKNIVIMRAIFYKHIRHKFPQINMSSQSITARPYKIIMFFLVTLTEIF